MELVLLWITTIFSEKTTAIFDGPLKVWNVLKYIMRNRHFDMALLHKNCIEITEESKALSLLRLFYPRDCSTVGLILAE